MAEPDFKLVKHFNFSVLPPVLTREQFSSLIGTTPDTVRGWIQTNTVPTVKIGRQRLVNLALMSQELTNGKTDFKPGDYLDNNRPEESR